MGRCGHFVDGISNTRDFSELLVSNPTTDVYPDTIKEEDEEKKNITAIIL